LNSVKLGIATWLWSDIELGIAINCVYGIGGFCLCLWWPLAMVDWVMANFGLVPLQT